MLEKLSATQRKMISWLGFVVVVGIGFMLVQSPSSNQQVYTPISVTQTTQPSNDSYTKTVAAHLESILSNMAGVGRVEVFITLERGSKIVVAQQVTQERNEQQQESRLTSTPVTLRLDGEKKEVPLVLEEYEPILRGVLVIAEGAEDPDLRYKIFQATQTVLQIPGYRIEVLPKAK